MGVRASTPGFRTEQSVPSADRYPKTRRAGLDGLDLERIVDEGRRLPEEGPRSDRELRAFGPVPRAARTALEEGTRLLAAAYPDARSPAVTFA